ncbi:MAG: hypothetical protein PF439_07640 [Helicobacteraceae bacterium]|jgi:hypothetical protein|nr:hypothetical protein [Helicobacteraceae bacterium]
MPKASTKREDNTKRLRYIRVLERFTSSITNYLSKVDDPTKELFDKKVDNNRRYLERIEKIALYKGEFNDLEKLVEKIIAFRDSDEEIEEIKNVILYSANQIEKSVNQRQYKKDKHTSSQFKDWE